ncbi:MAG: hypothetical protein GC181_15970 [Bacteroidetes bacterium]|nr:hypothetical protein [Bacteroidota bacterium]
MFTHQRKTTLLLALVFATVANAQFMTKSRPKYEWSVGVGTSTFFGDIGGANRDGKNLPGLTGTDLTMVKPAYSFSIKQNFKQRSAVKARLICTRAEGDDLNAKDLSRRKRNLRFVSPLIRLSFQYQYTVAKNLLKNVSRHTKLEYYIYAGLGATYFEPKTQYNGEWVKLRKLGTEGQGLIPGTRLYRPFTATIPVGGGLKLDLKSGLSFFGELTFNATNSDYIDDVHGKYYDSNSLLQNRGPVAAALSYRGSSETYPKSSSRGSIHSKDHYATLVIGVSMQLGRSRTAPKKLLDEDMDNSF